MVYRHFSDEEVATALRMQDEGRTFAEIGKVLGRSRHSIAGCLFRVARATAEGRLPRKARVAARREEYRAAVDAGLTAQEIADRYGVSPKTVHGNLRRYGLRPNRPRRS